MKVDGACHCGAIRYAARVDPRRVVLCHCTDCQTISGAPYRVNVPAAAETFQLTGRPKTYVKTGGSGEPVTTAFCGDCGSALYSCKGEAPAFLFLRTGAIRQRADLIPTTQGFCASAMPWSADIRDVRVVS